MYNFANKPKVEKVQTLIGNVSKSAGLASIGAGIGAIREVGKLRDKINKRYAEACAKADAQGKPRPPRPDTSTKTLMAVLKGSVKGAVLGTAVGFIPGVGRGLQDTVASLGAGINKLATGNVLGGKVITGERTENGVQYKNPYKTFSFMNTFLPTREFSESENYTLTYLTDNDFAEINLSNLDIGDVTEIDLYKMFFSLAHAASKSFTRQELQEHFSRRKKIVRDNSSRTAADAKLTGMSEAAMPVLGAIAGGGLQAIKARKRALELWKAECRIAEAKGLPKPPKPSILTLAGDVAKGAAVGAGIGWVGKKIAPNLNKSISQGLSKFGLVSKKGLDNAADIVNKTNKSMEKSAANEKHNQLVEGKWYESIPIFGRRKIGGTIDNANIAEYKPFSYVDYRAALARKGQETTLTEEQFNNCSPEYYEILIRNMQPMNFNALGPGTIANPTTLTDVDAYDEWYRDMGRSATIGATAGLVIGCIEAGKDYNEYKAEAEAKGEEPISRAKYILTSKRLGEGFVKGAGKGLFVGSALYGLKRAPKLFKRKDK